MPDDRPSHSPIGIVSVAFALLSILVPAPLLVIFAMGDTVSRRALLACAALAACCCTIGVVAGVAALFDRKKNRMLGLAGWWIGLLSFSLVALLLRTGIHHKVLTP